MACTIFMKILQTIVQKTSLIHAKRVPRTTKFRLCWNVPRKESYKVDGAKTIASAHNVYAIIRLKVVVDCRQQLTWIPTHQSMFYLVYVCNNHKSLRFYSRGIYSRLGPHQDPIGCHNFDKTGIEFRLGHNQQCHDTRPWFEC